MLPLVDKPIIQYGVEEAVASGVPTSSSSRVAARMRSRITSTCRSSSRSFLEQRGKTEQLDEIREISSLISVVVRAPR